MAAIEIGAFAFATKRAAQSEIRRILHDTPLNRPLVGAELELIAALLGLHHEAKEKIGPGVAKIEVRQIEYGSRGFWVTRTDGSAVDFSYRTALNGAGSHRSQCLQAMRFAVAQQIKDFRRAAFAENPDQVCPLTGIPLTNDPTTHVDHIVEFSTIADVFATTVGGWHILPIGSSVTHPGPALGEPWVDLWREFHAEHAQLRIIHSSANLMRVRRVSA